MALTWSGNGRGNALLLHGMMSLAGTWWRIGPALAERGWDITAIDLAAHGGHRLDGPLTAEALVDSVTAQVTGPVDLLVGHSMGAATAASTIVRQPGFARAVVLEEPARRSRSGLRAVRAGRRAGRRHRPSRPRAARPPVPGRPPGLGRAGRRVRRTRHRAGGRVGGRGRDPDGAARLGHAGPGGEGRRARPGAGGARHPWRRAGPARQRAERGRAGRGAEGAAGRPVRRTARRSLPAPRSPGRVAGGSGRVHCDRAASTSRWCRSRMTPGVAERVHDGGGEVPRRTVTRRRRHPRRCSARPVGR